MNSKFRGTLTGVLIGDCVGAIFEGEAFDAGCRLVLKNFLKNAEAATKQANPRLKFTDDTAMTTCVAKSLISYAPETFQKELAKSFVKEYFSSPGRGYGEGVTRLFHLLKRDKFEDFLDLALNQFGGRGSFGNGAAMRVSPVALYCLNKSEDFLIDLVRKTAVITHANPIGIHGAALQALAVHQNLKIETQDTLDPIKYLEELVEKFKKVETGEDEQGIPEEKHFTKQLDLLKALLKKKYTPSDEEVVNSLGHSVNALYSVPTAIYCFLRIAQSNNADQNPISKTLEYTVSLGGDTDTIASMACALSGAYFGDTCISENLVKRCENSEAIVDLADQLYNVSCKRYL